MDIGLLIPPTGRSAAPPSSTVSNETGGFQQPTQNGAFSAVLKHAAQKTYDEQRRPLSDTVDSLESAPPKEADDQATGTTLSGIAVEAFSQVQDLHQAVSPVVDMIETLLSLTGCTLQSIESIPLISQDLSAATPEDDGTPGHELLQAIPPEPTTTEPSLDSLPQLVLAHDQSSETPAIQGGSQSLDVPSIRNGRGAAVDLAPLPLEQPAGNLTLSTPPPGSLISDQGPSPVMENQGAKNLLPAVLVNGGVPSPERPSAAGQPLGLVQEQGTQATALLGQSLSVSVIGESGEGEQDSFGSDAQGAGEGTFFHSGESGSQESGMRDNRSSFFNGQFTSVQQVQSSTKGEGSSVVTPEADHLKMAQTLLGEAHSATMTSAYGKAQVVHMELPSHDSGPLSVRISMTDQTVHTQFTTDRNDLGALLFTRQDQLQQNLTKSGLELGQFQVNIDQRGQQEALPDRQPRRNGEAPDQPPASQDHNQEAQDRERLTHRSSRVLSLFA